MNRSTLASEIIVGNVGYLQQLVQVEAGMPLQGTISWSYVSKLKQTWRERLFSRRLEQQAILCAAR